MDESASFLQSRANFNYPRPLSAPPSPTSSKHTSVCGSDDEDSVDDELELHELSLSHKE